MSTLSSFLLPYILPVVISGLGPYAIEYAKHTAEFLVGRLPKSVVLMLASLIAEGANQLQSWLASGPALPPGLGAVIAMFVNELLSDLGKQPTIPKSS